MEFQANAPTLRAIVRVALLLCAVNWLAASHSLQAQTSAPPQPDTRSEPPRYEVASIRPHKPDSDAGGWGFSPNGFGYSGVTLELLITSAYGVTENQVSGLPGWVRSSYYDFQARVDANTAEAWKNLSIGEIAARQEPMLQSLLADRCQLKAHLEAKELPVYDLVIAKGGLKMKEAPADEKHDGMLAEGHVIGRSTLLELLAENLSNWSGRLVVDQTGLGQKRFDFDLKWTPEDRRDADPANAGPSIFTALEEQLGLKLVPAKAPVHVLVIDHMERPSPN
jgi:uncharacterized protein (TIGR03435 family)